MSGIRNVTWDEGYNELASTLATAKCAACATELGTITRADKESALSKILYELLKGGDGAEYRPREVDVHLSNT